MLGSIIGGLLAALFFLLAPTPLALLPAVFPIATALASSAAGPFPPRSGQSSSAALAPITLPITLFIARAKGMPLVVEISVAFSILIAFIVIGIFLFRIRERFDSVDVSALDDFRGERR